MMILNFVLQSNVVNDTVSNTAQTIATNEPSTESISYLSFLLKGGVLIIPIVLLLFFCIYVIIERYLSIKKINQNNIDKIIEIKNSQYLEDALKENKGVIIVSAHYGCWELLGVALQLKFATTLNVIVQRPSSPVFDRLFTQSRKLFGINTYYNSDGISGIRPIFRALYDNQSAGFLIDQHGESEDNFGHFFGKVVSMPSGAAIFAQKTKSPIVPVFIKRLDNNKHQITFYPPIHVGKSEKDEETYKISQKLYGIIEKFIKDNPDEWLWIYRRWNKLSPEGLEIANNIKKHKRKEFSYEEN